MRAERYKWENVREDGTMADQPGAVETKPGMWVNKQAKFVRVCFGRTADGVVEGITFWFSNRHELKAFLKG